MNVFFYIRCATYLLVSPNILATPQTTLMIESGYLSSMRSDSIHYPTSYGANIKWSSDWKKQPQYRIEVDYQKGFSEDGEAFALRDFVTSYSTNNFNFYGGITSEFWGVTESRHLVNVINPADARFDKYGQKLLSVPIFKAGILTPGSQLSLYLMPCQRHLSSSSSNSHNYGNSATSSSESFVDIECDGLTDFALRDEVVYGPIDLGLSYFKGISREINGGVNSPSKGGNYPIISRYSIDIQATIGPSLYKLEMLAQTSSGHDYASVGGIEYLLPYSESRISDFSILAEYLWDTRCIKDSLNCGAMLGARWVANNASGTQMLATYSSSRYSDQYLTMLKWSQRITGSSSIFANANQSKKFELFQVGIDVGF